MLQKFAVCLLFLVSSSQAAVPTYHVQAKFSTSYDDVRILASKFSPDGKVLLVAAADENILINTESTEIIGKLEMWNARNSRPDFTPDGEYFFSGAFPKLWRTDGLSEVVTFNVGETGMFDGMLFSPDGKLVTALMYGMPHTELQTYSPVTGALLATTRLSNTMNAGGVAFVDARHVMTSICKTDWNENCSLVVMDVLTGKQTKEMSMRDIGLEKTGWVDRAAITPSGDLAVITKGSTVSIIDLRKGLLLGSFKHPGELKSIRDLQISSDGKTLMALAVVGKYFTESYELGLWDIPSATQLISLRHPTEGAGIVMTAAMSLDGKRVFLGADESVLFERD
jgi:WD40 repeat protein